MQMLYIEIWGKILKVLSVEWRRGRRLQGQMQRENKRRKSCIMESDRRA